MIIMYRLAWLLLVTEPFYYCQQNSRGQVSAHSCLIHWYLEYTNLYKQQFFLLGKVKNFFCLFIGHRHRLLTQYVFPSMQHFLWQFYVRSVQCSYVHNIWNMGWAVKLNETNVLSLLSLCTFWHLLSVLRVLVVS